MEGEMNQGPVENQREHDSSVSQERPPHKKSDIGALVGIIVIIIVLVIGGLYFYGSRVNDPTPTEDEQTNELLDVNESDELDAIEEDLDNTELEGLDAELDTIADELENI